MVKQNDKVILGAGVEPQKQAYEKPSMTEHEPLEEATAYIYYYRIVL